MMERIITTLFGTFYQKNASVPFREQALVTIVTVVFILLITIPLFLLILDIL